MQKSLMFIQIFVLSILFLATVLPGCGKSTPAEDTQTAASNSYLECAAKDVLGNDTPVLRLSEPGMCPGHFDIRPSQVQRLRRCRVLLRLDFQTSMDAKLAGAADAGLTIVPIRVPGGLCEPDSFLTACRQSADALVGAGLLEKDNAAERLRHIETRLETLSLQCRKDMKPLKNTPVVCSVHQEAFCRWLGLDVVATFRGADTESQNRMKQAYDRGKAKHVRLVIANRPEGRRCADFLAERLDAKVAVFDNFPAMNDRQSSFDDMVRDNISNLLEAN